MFSIFCSSSIIVLLYMLVVPGLCNHFKTLSCTELRGVLHETANEFITLAFLMHSDLKDFCHI